MYLPNAKLGIVNDIISMRVLALIILRRVNRLNLSNNTALRHQHTAVLLRHIGQNRHDKRVRRLDLAQSLRQPHHSLHIVPVSRQKRHIGSTRPSRSLGWGDQPDRFNSALHDLRRH